MNTTTYDPKNVKLGKRAPKLDKRTLTLSKYTAALPQPPLVVNWASKVPVPWGMMLNDTIGDCTCAAAGHLVVDWTANASTPVVLPDQDILDLYEKVGGYVPGNPATDNGCTCIDVLNYWRQTGIGPGGHKIAAYVSVNMQNATEVRQAIALFGGVYIGVNLPTSAQAQVGQLWEATASTPGDAGSWGGHCVPIVGYVCRGKNVIFTCVTWGALQRMTKGWTQAYSDEGYAIVTNDWIKANQSSPSGFDIAQLQADLALVTGTTPQ